MNAHFKFDVDHADNLATTAIRNGTDRLLELLKSHHSYDMQPPKGWKKREPKKPPAVPSSPLWFRMVDDKPLPTMDNIIRVVAAFYGVTPMDLRSGRRDHKVVRPRMIVTYLAKKLTKLSYPQIGKFIGGRDHSTAVHAFQKIERLLESGNAQLQADVDELSAKFAVPE
jgi:hypothetical protein